MRLLTATTLLSASALAWALHRPQAPSHLAPNTPPAATEAPRLVPQDSPLRLANAAFAAGRYDEALQHYRRAQATGSRFAWLADMIRTVERRRALGDIRPEAVHRICAVYVTDVYTVLSSGERRHRQDVTDEQRAEWRVSFGVVRQVMETFSDGGWSLDVREVDAVATHAEGARLKIVNPDHLNLEAHFFDNAHECDTYITISNTTSPAMALARRYPYVHGAVYGPHRGMAALNAGSHGWGVLLHEFFHVVEWVAGGVGGAHSYRDDLRHQVPGWTGTTEYDYYRWQFANTLAPRGWTRLNHTNRWRHPITRSAASRDTVAAAYAGIPLADRQWADTLVRLARDSEPDAAVRLWEEALALSPYQQVALSSMHDHFRSRSPDSSRAAAYASRLATLRAVNDFFTVLPETNDLGPTVALWRPEQITVTGSVLEWDISPAVGGGGFDVSFWYIGGGKAVRIAWVALLEDGTAVAQDTHNGWSGTRKENITYRLSLPAYRPNARYTLQAHLTGQGGTTSNGLVLQRPH